MKVKDDFFKRGSFILGNGRTIRFWEDPWINGAALSSQYPTLYNIVRQKNVTVFYVLSIPFKYWVSPQFSGRQMGCLAASCVTSRGFSPN